MKHKNLYRIALVIALLLIVSLACGSSNEGEVVTPASQEAELAKESPTGEEDPKPSYEVFGVGDLIKVKDHTIRLNSINYQGSVLIANFTLENHGSSDLNVSSMLSFTAKKSDGTKLDQEFFNCGISSLDGSVLPSDKLKGDICWSGANSSDGIKIYYKAELFSSGAVVWVVE